LSADQDAAWSLDAIVQKNFPMIFLTVTPDGTHLLPQAASGAASGVQQHLPKALPLGLTLCLAWLLSASNAQGLLDTKIFDTQRDILRLAGQQRGGNPEKTHGGSACLGHNWHTTRGVILLYFP
jgi:hypothetical protein